MKPLQHKRKQDDSSASLTVVRSTLHGDAYLNYTMPIEGAPIAMHTSRQHQIAG